MMINLRMAAFSMLAMASMVGCTTETGELSEASSVGSTNQASVVVGAKQVCCTNIPSWGSVIYYQENVGTAGSPTWVTYSSDTKAGVQCPYVDNTCAPVKPAFEVTQPGGPGWPRLGDPPPFRPPPFELLPVPPPPTTPDP